LFNDINNIKSNLKKLISFIISFIKDVKTEILNKVININNTLKNIFNKRDLLFNIKNIRAYIIVFINKNPLFKVIDYTVNITEVLVLIARLLKIKNNIKIVKDIKNILEVLRDKITIKTISKIILSILKKAINISKITKTYSFL
jgi:hypothetical protein